jgi:hypothetical protein
VTKTADLLKVGRGVVKKSLKKEGQSHQRWSAGTPDKEAMVKTKLQTYWK